MSKMKVPTETRETIDVLHVDDEPDLADLTATFLERENDRFTVGTAIRADEGLDRIDDRRPDCVVSDYNMPGTNGIEFLRAVREEYPDLPFILFTGKGSEAVASDAISAGVTDYLQKESGTEQYELLANKIRNAVHAQREARRADRQEQLMGLTELAGDTGGFELDVDSGDLLLTRGTRRLVGLPDDTQITLEEAIALYHPDDQADVRRTVSRAAETGEQTRGTWRLQPGDGDERLVDVTITPATEHSDVTTLRGAIHDVTERRKRRQELEQTETLFQHAQDSLFLIDVADEFTVERVNPAYEAATGLSADRMRGRTPREILGEQQGGVVERRYRDCVERREPLEYTEHLDFGAESTQWETRIAPVVFDGSVEYIVGATRDVTDREERQQELQRLQQAIDDANVSITLADPSQPDDPLVYVNNAFEEMTGYPPAETLGRNCRFLQGEDTDSEKIATLREAIDNEESTSVELRNYRNDGTEFWNRLTVTPIYNDDDELVRYLGTQEDVTERKERERELREERRFIEQALDTLDDLFYVLDTDGSLRRWNERVPETTGYADSELAEMQAIELFPETERETAADAIQMAVSGRKVTFEADLLTADGECRPYEFTGARLTDEDGNVTGLVGVGRDLTERHQRERRFQALVEESSDIISIVDADGVFQYQSPSIERILGYDPGETIGNTAWEYVHPDDRVELVETFERGLTDTDANPVMEYRARHADGSWRWLEARGNNQLENPAVEGYVVNSREITDRKERERELKRVRDLMSDMEELADIGAWEYDPETETTTMTDGTRRIHGLGPGADLSLAEAFECVHPEDRGLLTDRFDECLESGEPYEVDARLATAEGPQRWVAARGERVDQSESDSVVRGYIRDITEERTRERQLTELNEVSKELLTAQTQQEVADIGVKAARDVLDFRANAIHLCEGADMQLAPVAQTAELTSLVDSVPALSVADSIAGRAYQRGDPIVTEDARQDPDVHDPETDLRGHVYLPLAGHGVLIAGSEAPAAFDQQDRVFGELLAGALAAALDRIDREQTARQRQKELSLFFEQAPLGAVQWDEQFQFERVNGRAEKLLGYSESELRGESWELVVADDDREQVGDAVESLVDADGTTQVIASNVRKDGETLTCEWHNRAVTDSDGSIQSVFSKFRDVTDRERRRTELQEFETIIDSLTDAVYVLDEKGRFTYVSDELVELVGYSRDTMLGNTPSLIKDEDAVEQAEQALGRLLSSDGPETVTFEVTLQPRDGDPIRCEDHMGVLPYEGDQFEGSVGTLRDITERRERTRELERKNARLEEFASIVSHDLRNPLMTAQGHLELAGAECTSSHLDAVGDAVDRCQALVEDLLALARSGDSVGAPEPVTLSELADECWQTTPSADATLAVETDLTVSADRSRLKQLLENLFRNAVEHGGREVTVTVGEVDDGFCVADDGTGLSERERDRVFDAGHSAAGDGTGIGLTIVRQIAEAHGWEIRVTDSETGGARFEIVGVETVH